MKVQHYRELDPISVPGIEATTRGMTIRRVFGEVDGASDFMMDVFEIKPEGHSELHEHSWEHQVFVVSGRGEIAGSSEPVPFGPGDVIFIPPGQDHQFRNVEHEPVVFVCSVPKGALTAYYIDQAADVGGHQ